MLPYEKIARGVPKIANDQVFAIDFPSRAFLTKLTISEITGANINPTIDVFSIDPSELPDLNKEIRLIPYKVLPTLQMNSGVLTEYTEDEVPYQSHSVNAALTPIRKIWIRINGTDEGTFDFAVAGWNVLSS